MSEVHRKRSRTIRCRVHHDKGFYTVDDGHEEYLVSMEVDWDKLADYLHARAAASKHSKATACGGAVVVRVKGRVHHTPA